MNVILCYRDEPLGAAWRSLFGGVVGVSIVAGDICHLPCDAIVSPANSFGFMDGGLDHRLSEHFGWELQERVQAAIQVRPLRPLRELLVGEAIVVPTGNARTPWLICAPTMRVAMRIRTSINAYLAMKAILVVARSHRTESPIETVAVPGLGTSIGQLAPELAAAQMLRAYREVILGDGKYPSNFAEAQRRRLALNRSSMLYE